VVTLSRTTTGLLYQSDGSLTGWTNGGSWSSASDPAFVVFDALPIYLFSSMPSGENGDGDGCREFQLFVESGTWYLLYDAGDHINGWRQYLARSYDRGLTWQRLGILNNGLTKIGGGSHAAVATGWLEKRSSTYYLHRVTAPTGFANPNVGLPNAPYGWDTWTATTITGTWTASRNQTGSGWAADEFLPGSVVFDGASTYYGFAQGWATVNSQGVGLSTATDPTGPFTATGSKFLTSATTAYGGRSVENPKVFYYSPFSKYVCLTNQYPGGGRFTDQNGINMSSSLSDWSAATSRVSQTVCPADSTNAIGVACHVTAPEATILYDATTGIVPITFDGDPTQYDGGSWTSTSPVLSGSHGAQGWHINRKCKTAAAEPSALALRYSGSGDTTSRGLSRSLSHTDITVECGAEPTAFHGSGGSLTVEYRSDGAGTCYRARLASDGVWSLYKVVSTTETLAATGSGSQAWVVWAFPHRLKVQVIGNVHKAWLNGELQYTHTDSSSPISSGTTLALNGKGYTGDVRCLSCRTSDTVTVSGLNPTTSCVVRGYGSFPAGAITSNSGGSGTFTHSHYPLAFLEFEGADYTPTGGIWGGDTLTFSSVPAATVGTGLRAIGR